jgi:hypothetical protein
MIALRTFYETQVGGQGDRGSVGDERGDAAAVDDDGRDGGPEGNSTKS